ncbi:nuclear transport factor 2 family protein [Elioraea rosea]|uniref:nuclear transport factor 2 family protein n=1 Tax=Elioraea rosea TaxID=2492390 RepID=UPI00118461EE|nr:nuclear transport factor 2 family protein [Elioraea rosea]
MTLGPPLPPFTRDTAMAKVRAAENAWNTRNPATVALAYTPESRWRNREEFFSGRAAIEDFLARKWAREREYRLIKELWAFAGAAIAVRFVYESCDPEGRWWQSHGNENWLFAPDGLMNERHASINDVAISEAERLFRWPLGTRPGDHPGLTELGL